MKNKAQINLLPSYAENPNLGFTVIDTFDGKKEYRKNCKYVAHKYYVINKDIFYVESENLWIRESSGKIEKDYELNKWYLKNTVPLSNGVVDVDENHNPIYGKFSLNPYNNCYGYIGGSNKFFIKQPEDPVYFEDVAQSILYRKIDMSNSDVSSRMKIRPEQSYTNKGYNIEDNSKEFKEKIGLYKNYNLPIKADAKKYGKYLADISYGCEIECSVGACPNHIQNRHGIVICRDGSLEGGQKIR